MIGTDGGLMPAPQTVRSLRHSMAERYEIVIDFAKYNPIGTRVVLRNTSPPNNIDFPNTDKIMAFDVTERRVRHRQQRDPGRRCTPTTRR